MEEKVCLTTYIHGDKYQRYIPFLVYSFNRSYPEYDIILFLSGTVNTEVKKQLEEIDACHCRIVENTFDDCPRMSPLKSQCFRWVLWDDAFLDYDYLYVVDIDMLYFREPTPLHVQHCIHMKTKDLPYDNMRRREERRRCSLISILYRIKHAGLSNIVRFLFGPKTFYRATGLHFVDVRNYYAHMTKDKLLYYKNLIYSGDWMKWIMYPNDEALFYWILEDCGIHPERMCLQTNSWASLAFSDCERNEFRPHHGIHMGIFRSCLNEKINSSDYRILTSEAYCYYFERLKKDYITDKRFINLINSSTENIKAMFAKMFDFCGISPNENGLRL